jgi:uncharacterized RDD family membrane protein YckC
MPQDGDHVQGQRYASFRLRLRAFLLDVLILAAVVVVGMTAMTLSQDSQANVGILVVLAGFGLAYEPLMVSFCEGTLGHRWSNLRIVDARTETRLSLWRALLRTWVKGAFGMLSFVFILITQRSQSLHDLAARSAVTIRNPGSARPRDYALPPVEQENRSMPSRARRATVIGGYVLLFSLVLAFVHLGTLSEACIDHDACSGGETATLTLSSGLWMIAVRRDRLDGMDGSAVGVPLCEARVNRRNGTAVTASSEPSPAQCTSAARSCMPSTRDADRYCAATGWRGARRALVRFSNGCYR